MQALPSLIMLLTSRWSRGLLGAAILSALVWSFLPAIPALAGPLPRALAIVALFAVFGVVTFLVDRRARRRARAVEAAVAEGGDGADTTTRAGAVPRNAEASGAQAEIAALRGRVRDAIAALRKRGVKRLYELPWYVIIGPPGAGKTTALRHSGLHFPLDTETADPVQGVGGTRLCDWWFSEEAVLIDTAGRYTTQDSNCSVDKAGWLGFLDLLRKTRPRQPINGVLVVIALSELLESTPEGREAHARAIRLRINELEERLRVRLPVYLLVSKMDRLAGFDGFFETLDSQAREQVWGVTFGLDEGQEAFAPAFRALVERIDARLVDRLQAERGPDRRALLSGFPLQLSSLEPVLVPFVATCFAGSRIDPAPLLRGVYLTSATQNGTPFDRLTGMLAHSFDIDQKRVAPLRPLSGRAFFLKRLVHEVVLGETKLVSTTPQRYRRRKILRAATLVAISLFTLAGLGAIWASGLSARVAVQHKQDEFAAYRRLVDSLPQEPVGQHDDLPKVSAVLDAAAALAATDPQPLGHWLGLSSHTQLQAAGHLAYQDALAHLLYPRLIWRLEQQIRQNMQNPPLLYDATRVYLLLGGQGPSEPEVIRSWLQADWAERYNGALNAGLREHLARHLDALLAEPLPASQLPLDGALVAQARIAFSRISPAQRVYDRLLAGLGQAQAGEQPGWSPELALGRIADENFVRGSGAPLTDGIPSRLTGAAFADIMRHQLPPAAQAVADESWVVGKDPGIATGTGDVASLEEEVARLWASDATSQWDTLLADLDLRPFGDHQHTRDTLYLLSSPQSPLRDMLISIARALYIAPPPAADPGAAVVTQWNAHWQPLFDLVGIDDKAAPADAVPAKQGSAGASPPPTQAQPPHPPMTAAGSRPLDAIEQLIGQLDNELAVGASTPGALPQYASQTADPAARLLAEAARQPHPLSQWLRQMAQAGGAALGDAAHQAASGAYSAPGGPDSICHGVVDGHYPFARESGADAPVAGFARLFAPGGAFDQYFQTAIAPYVDTTTSAWHLHPAGGVNPPFGERQLASFRKAALLRDTFFPAGAQPTLYLQLNLGAPSGVTLHLGGITVTPGVPASLSWPGADMMSPAALVRVVDGKTTTLLTESGPWALLRLLGDADDKEKQGPGQTRFTFERGGSDLTIDIDSGSGAAGVRPGSIGDPFNPHLFSDFSCPRMP